MFLHALQFDIVYGDMENNHFPSVYMRVLEIYEKMNNRFTELNSKSMRGKSCSSIVKIKR